VPFFCSEVFRDVGAAFLVSILDLNGINPMSRLLKADSDEPQDVLKKLRKDLQREYFKPSLKSSLKKKGAKTKRSRDKEGPSFELVLGSS